MPIMASLPAHSILDWFLLNRLARLGIQSLRLALACHLAAPGLFPRPYSFLKTNVTQFASSVTWALTSDKATISFAP
jgi:hypothetical protein